MIPKWFLAGGLIAPEILSLVCLYPSTLTAYPDPTVLCSSVGKCCQSLFMNKYRQGLNCGCIQVHFTQESSLCHYYETDIFVLLISADSYCAFS